jgi:serine/threonine protein kinase
VQRFKQEARAVSALNHPSILTIHQIGELDGRQFIATEFVEGRTLRELAKHQRFSFADALDIATQIGSALAAAHEADIMHRDIKPENVMVRPDGYVKVLDFGLAKLTERSVTGSDASTLINTEQGTIIGTVQYMSPEQARGLSVDVRTDIWSLGVALYEMLTEHPPFDGDTKSDVIAAILEREPSLLTHYNEDGPEALQLIITRALKKDRNARYQTAKDLLVDLRGFKQRLAANPDSYRETRTQSPVFPLSVARKNEPPRETSAGAAARPTSSAEYVVSEIKQHKTAVAVVLLTVVVAVTAIAFWFSRITGRNRSIAHPQAMTMTRLATSDRVQGAAISPDGKYIAYVVVEPVCCFQQSLRLRQIDTSSDIQIDPPSGLYHDRLVFSRDGNFLYFTDNSGNLYQMPTIGGPKTKLITRVASPFSFSPDGKRFAFLRDNYPNKDETALMVANADGSGEVKIASRKKPDFFGGGPAWSPSEQTIACAAGGVDDRGRYMNVVEVQLQGGGERPLSAQKWNSVGPVAWLSDGSGLLMLAEDQASIFSPQLWHVSYPNGDARRITNDFNSYESLSLTADSTILLTEQLTQSSNVWIASSKPAQARQITSGTTGSYDNISWLSDGQLIYDSNTGGSWDIWRLEVEKGTRRQITIKANANGESSVSPDGRYIVFVSNRAGPANIWRMDPDGGNPRQLTSGSSEDEYPQCTPDGKWVVYESTRSDKVTLWKVPIDGGDPVQLIDRPSENGAISPDGKWIVYESAGLGQRTLWKVSIDGGEPVQLLDEPSRSPTISPDGKLIACRYQPDPAKDEWKVAVVPFEGPPIQVFDIPAHPFWDRLGLRWSGDGKALTYHVHQNGIDRNGIDNIWIQPIDGGPPKQLTRFDSNQIFSFAWSRDGRLALSRGVETRDVVLLTKFR